MKNTSKIYLDNTNILYAVNTNLLKEINLSTIRETFFINCIQNSNNKLVFSKI